MARYLTCIMLILLSLLAEPVYVLRAAPPDVTRFVELKRLGNGTFTHIAISPDGTTLALTTEIGVWLYDAKTLTPRLLLGGHIGNVESVSWAPNSQSLVSGGADGTVRLWHVADGLQVAVLSADKDGVLSVAWSPDGHFVASGGYDGQIRIWAVAGGQFKLRLGTRHPDWVLALAWSPGSDELASGDRTGNIRIWSATDKPVREMAGHASSILSLAWSPDGKRLASGSFDKTARLWDVTTGQTQRTLSIDDLGYQRGMVDVDWSPDGKYLTTILGGSGDVFLWDLANPSSSPRYLRQSQLVDSCWSADGSHLYAIDYESALQDIDTSRWEVQKSLERLKIVNLNSVALSPDKRFVAVEYYHIGIGAVPDERGIAFWDLEKGGLVKPTNLDDIWPVSAAWSPDGSRLVVGGNGIFSSSYSIRLVRFADGKELDKLNVIESEVNSVAWSLDGTRLATGGIERTVQVWDPEKGDLLYTFEGHQREVTSVAWSPNGRQLASASRDGTVRIWDAGADQLPLEIQADPLGVLDVAWSPDGTRLVTAGQSKLVVWEINSQRPQKTLKGHTLAVLSAAWSPDGKFIASGGIDGTIRIWNAVSGELLTTLNGYVGQVSGVAWSSDGTRLISIGADNTVRIWGVP